MPTVLSHDSLAVLGGPEAALLDTRKVLASTHVGLGRAQLAKGLSIVPTISLDRESVRFDVMLNGLVVFTTTLGQGKLCDRWTGNQGFFKEDLTFCADLAEGELTVSGDLCVLTLTGWSCQRFENEVLVAWSPTIGAVGGQIEAHPPEVSDATMGPSRSIVPTITRIPVDSVRRVGTSVGNLVKSTYFADVPDFLFNVCFAVGWFPLAGPGVYGDPTNGWFNVFVGYYQIDCPKPAWTRPFGYDISSSGRAVNFDDVVRIGKADWNYFSNWMYGVPLEAVMPYDPLDPDTKNSSLGRRRVGASEWDLVDVNGFSVVTAYTSNAPGAAGLVDNSILTPAWRLTYGEPNPQSGHDTSFPGTKMHARLYMAYSEDESAYHTYLFGGTVNKTFDGPANDALLAEQMRAVEAVMTTHYPQLGFPI